MKPIGSIAFLFLTLRGLTLGAQEKVSQEIELDYFLRSDLTITLEVVINDEEEYEPVAGQMVTFYTINGKTRKILGEALTDDNGKAALSNISQAMTLKSKEGMLYFEAVSAETELLDEGTAKIDVFEAQLKVSFEEIDSVKTLVVNLTGYKDDEPVGLPDGEIYFFVPRLFGELNIGEAWTDEDGQDQFEFPTDIPGDARGQLTIIARISDSEEYGNIEVGETINWGVAVEDTLPGPSRTLWSVKPPLWMVLTFAVLMAGVWGHYIWVVINLVRIKRAR